MNILALSDIHGSYRIAADIIAHESPDVLIIAGDLTNVGSVKEAEQAIRDFGRFSPRLLCVAGNMDLPQHDELYARLGMSVNGRGIIIDRVGFFGVSAAPHSRLHTPYELSESEIAERIDAAYRQVSAARVKIMIPHAPPYGTKVDIIHAGIHVGSTAVREFIEAEQPDVVVCGHIHESRGQDSIDKSRIVNCGTAAHGYYVKIKVAAEITVTSCHHPFKTSNPPL